jgi:glycosyltransferase involved in cell wall biosynthesis
VYYRVSKSLLWRVLSPNLVRGLVAAWVGLRRLGNPRFDLLHANVAFPASLQALLLSAFKGIPYVVTEHYSGYLVEHGTVRGTRLKFLTRVGLSRASAITTVSRALADSMLALGLPGKYEVIPNVAEPAPKPTPNHEGERNPDLIRFVHVSLLNDTEKNVSGILRCLRRLADRRQDFRLHIVGSGPSEGALKALASQLRLDSHVVFEGLMEHTELLATLPSFAFLVMFSNFETFCVAAAEAIAAGIPVICTTVGGPIEYIGPEQGILVPPRDEEALLASIESMLQSHRDFDREALRAHARQRFSRVAVGRQFERLYRQVLENELPS